MASVYPNPEQTPDEFWDELMTAYIVGPLTPEEAERAYAEAPEVPMTEGEIRSIVDYVLRRDRDGVRDAGT
jgi:hypothetical protein